MLVAKMTFTGVELMTSQRILQLNSVSTAACAVGMLATRGMLYPLFGLEAPLVLDLLAIGLLAYAGALAFVGLRQPVTRQALMVFTVADGLWVAGSAIVLLMFWSDLAPIARILIIAVGLVVDVFATLQYRAARHIHLGSMQIA
jgi:hypothetical protein